MSDTPRTFTVHISEHTPPTWLGAYGAMKNLAETMERELNAANAANAKLEREATEKNTSVAELVRDLLEAHERIAELEAWQRAMVEKAADKSLDGYRELAHKCAELETERDELKRQLAEKDGAL